MASLSTCHLGLWLGWQILLNLVKSCNSTLQSVCSSTTNCVDCSLFLRNRVEFVNTIHRKAGADIGLLAGGSQPVVVICRSNSFVMDVHFREFWMFYQDVQYSTTGIGGFLNGRNV